MNPIKIVLSGVDKYSTVLNTALKDIDSFGKKTKGLGTAMTAGLTLPILGAGIASVKFATDLNAGMANVATLIPNNIGRIKELKTAVQNLSIETGKSSTDIAEGLYQTVSTFQDSAETTKLLSINTKAAVAGLATVSDAINLTSSVTQVWGDTSAGAVQKVADFAFQTANLGKSTFPELAASISNVTLPAKTLGVSLNEMFAAVAYSSNITNSTSETATQFASAMKELLNPSKDLIDLMDYLGYKSGPEMVKGLGGVVPALQKITELSKTSGAPLQKLLGRSEAMLFALQFSGDAVAKFDKVLNGFNDTNVTGATERAFNEQANGINKTGTAMSRALQQLITLGQKFGDALSPAIDAVIKVGTPFLDWITKLSPETMKVTAAIAGVVAIVGPLIVGISTIAGIFIAATLPVVGWIAAIVGGAALVGGAVVLIIAKWKSIEQFFIGTFDFLKKLFHSRIGQFLLIAYPYTMLPTLIINNWNGIKDTFKTVFEFVKNTLSSFNDWLVKTPVYAFLKGLDAKGDVAVSRLGNGIVSKVTEFGKWALGSDQNNAFFSQSQTSPAGVAIGNSIREIKRTEVNKSEQKLKVEIAGLPQGSTVSSKGSLRNIDLHLGYMGITP